MTVVMVVCVCVWGGGHQHDCSNGMCVCGGVTSMTVVMVCVCVCVWGGGVPSMTVVMVVCVCGGGSPA